MQNSFAVLVVLLAQLPLTAVATAAPVVPEGSAQTVPSEVSAEWEARQSGLDARAEEVARRTRALDAAEAAGARADLGSARADATEAGQVTRSAVDGSRAQVAQAQLAVQSANHERRVRSSERGAARARGGRAGVLAAKHGMATAKGTVADAEGELAAAQRDLTAVEQTGAERVAGAARRVDNARSALTLPNPPSTERAELELLSVQVTEDRARLELERAVYANGHGDAISLVPYHEALAAAELESAAAAERLRALHVAPAGAASER